MHWLEPLSTHSNWAVGYCSKSTTCVWLLDTCDSPPPPLTRPFTHTHRYTAKQFLAVLLLTLGAISATCAEAFLGDTAIEAARRSLAAAVGGGAAISSPCVSCGHDGVGLSSSPDGMDPSPTGVLSAAAAAVGSLAAGNGSGSTIVPAVRQLMEGFTQSGGGVDGGRTYMLWWLMGVAILTTALVLQTLLSNYQNWCSGVYGAVPAEGMFWSHAMALPAFVLTAKNLRSHAALWNASPATAIVLGERWGAILTTPYTGHLLKLCLGAVLPLIGGIPIMWTYMAANILSQYLCICGLYTLAGWADPLTVNVALTVRKFASLMLSIWVFDNAFTGWHWAGAVLVFTGASLYGYWSGGGGAAPVAAPSSKDSSGNGKKGQAQEREGEGSGGGRSSAVDSTSRTATSGRVLRQRR